MRVLAVDLGTSNSVATVRTADGRIRPLLFGGSPLLPSAVYLAPDGRALVGSDAIHTARVDPGRFEPNPKRRVDDGEVLLGDRAMPVPVLFSHVFAAVLDEAARHLGGPPDELRLTHPARWGERRRAVLVEGARLAGLPPPRLLAEPVAAASYFTAVLGTAVPVGRSLAVYDLGGGTFDATVVRRTATGFEVLAEDGRSDLGGLDFDQALVDHLGRGFRDDPAWARLTAPVDAVDRRDRRMLYDDVRAAKERLSRTARADIHVPALEVDAYLTRPELETLIGPQLARTVACLADTVAAARLAPAELVGIFLVGGSSRIPLVTSLIQAELGVAPTTLDQPETVVAEGALCLGPVPAPRVVAARPVSASAPVSGPSAVPVSGAPGFAGALPAMPVSAAPAPLPVSVPPGSDTGPPTAPLVRPAPAGPRWYAEPLAVATLVVLALVVVAFVTLVALIA